MKRILALLLLLPGSGHAAAQGAQRQVCSPANGQKVSIAEVAANPAAWMGKCITVEGVYSSERIYADADAIYGVSNASIGGYVDGRGSMDGFWKGEFAGRVSDCASAQADLDTGLLRSPGISLNDRVLGCRKPEGPFLVFLVPRGLAPANIVRRLPGAKGGDLTPAPKDWPYRAAVEQIAGRFLAAMEGKDRTILKQLIQDDYAVERIAADTASAVSRLTGPVGIPPQVLIHRPAGAAAGDNAFHSEVCWCLERSCKWPIARRDADNQPSRPYACVRIDGSREGGKDWAYEVDASQDFDGLPEP